MCDDKSRGRNDVRLEAKEERKPLETEKKTGNKDFPLAYRRNTVLTTP